MRYLQRRRTHCVQKGLTRKHKHETKVAMYRLSTRNVGKVLSLNVNIYKVESKYFRVTIVAV